MGARSFLKPFSDALSSFRKAAPKAPVKIPRQRNHGSCVMRVNSNGGTVYQGRIPKKLRETMGATTEAKTNAPKRLMEKLPSTQRAEKTAPEIGALYAARIPEAAPQPTSNRSR